MQKLEYIFELNKPKKVLDFFTSKLNFVPYSVLLNALKNKDVRIDGEKISTNQMLTFGNKVCIFLPDQYGEKKLFDVVYEDDNVLVVNKQKNIEVCDGDINIVDELKKQNKKVFAVHRIDRNTTGLVILAKNKLAKLDLENAFKQGKIKKYYLTEVVGIPKENEKTLNGFLVKDAENSKVKIFANKKEGSVKITTIYRVIKSSGNTSLLEVEIPTGKTHQIRAHLAHIGYPVVGDDKYGDYEQNKKYKTKTQKLLAYKMTFDFDMYSSLAYLNKKVFELPMKL